MQNSGHFSAPSHTRFPHRSDFGNRVALPAQAIGLLLATFSLWLLGIAGLFAVGSAWDADLSLEISTGLVAFQQEELPFTPKSMVLVLIASGQTAFQLILVFKSSPVVYLPILTLFNFLSWLILRKLARAQLVRLTHGDNWVDFKAVER